MSTPSKPTPPAPAVSSTPTIDRDTVDQVFRAGNNGPGRLITIVGFDGCGKTTQIDNLTARLRARGEEVLDTRQPTDWYRRLGEVQAFESDGGAVETAHILALLAAADRRRHVMEMIDPALRRGATVICDRYVYATFGVFIHRGVDPALLTAINGGIPRPDLAFYLRVPTEELKRRLAARGEKLKHEEKSSSRIESIVGVYEQMGDALTEIDGTADPEVVTAQLLKHIDAL
ncbi:dTMP kinase [Natronoglycomyces albus]|uniref:Thymidylate kinase n=1 Tax=Natronoglycomyces albus TaxID=2811108 RepID=A0A895XQ34_9ACTN|nr:dTMP kinase [Natronoglycomyces albus]QSB04656.1 dTMP kinase [Natronoglycomyces albus]